MRRLITAVLGLFVACVAWSANPPPIALIDANVIPMDREQVIERQTILIENGRIAQIGPSSSIELPAGVRMINAAGKYVMPGLAEMHGHLAGGNLELNERILLLNVLHGVTTVRVMQGHPSHIELRARAHRGDIIAPHLYVAAPQLGGGSAKTPEEGVRLVEEAKRQGFDLLKIQEGLSLPAFQAIAKRANELGIGYAGHVPADVGLQHALDARFLTIDHNDGYMEALVPGEVDPTQVGMFGSGIVDRVDESRIAQLVSATKAAGVAVVPTETLLKNFLTQVPTEQLFSRKELRYMPAASVSAWRNQKAYLDKEFAPMTAAQRERFLQLRRKLLKALFDGGATVLLGSDAPQILNVPGVATLDELQLMVEAGLTPFQALESGTRKIAEHFRTTQDSGTVAAGKRADLIVLDANPLQDIANVRKQAGVMRNGVWVGKEEISARLEKLQEG